MKQIPLIHLLKHVYLYLGLFGLLIDFFVQIGLLSPLISEIFGIFLLAIVIYEVNLPNLALKVDNTAKWRWLISISGILSYIFMRYFLSNYVWLVHSMVALIALFLIVTWMLGKDINWSSLPIGLKKKYDRAYHSAEKEDPNFASKDVLLFWGLLRTSLLNLFRFWLTALLLLPYYVGLICSVAILAFFDEIAPTSLIASLALLFLAFLGVRQKFIRGLRDSVLRRHWNNKLKSVCNTLKILWYKKEESDQTRILSIITAFIKPRAVLYILILWWISALCFAFIFVSGYLLYTLPNILFNYPEYSTILLGLLTSLLLSSIIPLYLSVQLVSSLIKKDKKKIRLLRYPHFFLICSALLVGVILGRPQFTPFLPSMPSQAHLNVLNSYVYVVIIIGLIQACYLLWSLTKKGFTNLSDYGENKLTALLIGYTLLILLTVSNVFENIINFVLASWFWYAAVGAFKSMLRISPFGGKSKTNTLSLILCFLVTGIYLWSKGNLLFAFITFVGALSVAFLSLEESQMRRIGWILLGVREQHRP